MKSAKLVQLSMIVNQSLHGQLYLQNKFSKEAVNYFQTYLNWVQSFSRFQEYLQLVLFSSVLQKENHSHQNKIVKETCKQQKPSTPTQKPQQHTHTNKTNSTLSKVSREIILIISNIKNVSYSTHDKIWPNASIVR